MVAIDAAEKRLSEMVLKLYRLVDEALSGLESPSLQRGASARVDSIAKIAGEYRDSISSEATLFIARFQPLGRDLIMAQSVISVTYDLYRIARYAREISILADALGGLEGNVDDEVLNAMKTARVMVGKSVKALIEKDRNSINEVYKDDDNIDKVYHKYLDILASHPYIDRKSAASLLLARHVERIADHATYIAMAAEKLL
ncbi:MAG: PhoU domain-containing protein [Thermoprotei archaeon]|nr:PhoU domain-containing protein [Thermoprotei archaeon]